MKIKRNKIKWANGVVESEPVSLIGFELDELIDILESVGGQPTQMIHSHHHATIKNARFILDKLEDLDEGESVEF